MSYEIVVGDVLDTLPRMAAGSVHCCVTSPPYWGLRDYGVDGQIGLEESPEAFVAVMVAVFREVRRVLRDDGTLWLNLGDSYAGNRNGIVGDKSTLDGSRHNQDEVRRAQVTRSRRRDDAEIPRSDRRIEGVKPKDLCMMPWRVAMALQADGWWIRSVICWSKKSPMPEPVRDRPTTAWEPIFLMAKSDRYYYDAEAVKEATTGNAHSRGNGVNPKAAAIDPGDHHARPKANPSFSSAVNEIVSSRNMRNVWHLATEPYSEAHFATFPTEIPRRAILAGTSERGCCAACGAPWERMTDREAVKRVRPNDHVKREGEDGTGNSCSNTVAGVSVRTLGWEPGCECGADVVPCTVLDPFLGSGTTVAVARQLGRRGVGCEINPEYVELARERIGRAERPSTYASTRVGEAPLFQDGGAA